MDGARHHFLAGARFARDEHRGTARRHRFDHLAQVAHGLTAAYDAGQAVALFELLAQILVLGAQPALLEGRFEHVQQLFELEGLADEIRGAALDGVDRVFHGAVAGDDDADDARVALQRRGQHFAAVDAGQAQVGDEHVEGKAFELLEGLLARRRFGHLVPGVGEAFGHHSAQGIFVVDQKEMGRFRQGGILGREGASIY